MKKILKTILLISALFTIIGGQGFAEQCNGTDKVDNCEPKGDWYGRTCEECCSGGKTYNEYTVGAGQGNAKECCVGEAYKKNDYEEEDPGKFNNCCELPNKILKDDDTKDIQCCPEDTKILYGQYSHDKCCVGKRYGFSISHKNTLTIYNCCEAPNKLYTDDLAADQLQKAGDSIDEGMLNQIEQYTQICVDCKDCKELHDEIVATIAEINGQMADKATFPTDAEITQFQTELKPLVDKYRDEKHCEDAFPGHVYNCTTDDEDDDADLGDNTQTSSEVGIECTQEQMINGQCKFKVYDTLGIRQKETDSSVGIFVQDIILSATMFIGTIVTAAIIVSGLMFVFGGANPSLQDKAKKGLINAFIGLILVMSSYAVIRLVQFIVMGE